MKTETVAAYLQNLAPERRAALEHLRAMVLEVAPQATETMRYHMPTYHYQGEMLCAMASQKHYLSLYMDTGLIEKHKPALQGLDCGKSCIRFKKLEKLPQDAIRQILQETVRLIDAQ